MGDILIKDVKGKQLIVSELIELLKECPQDAKVYIDGADCWGRVEKIDYYKDDNEVLIEYLQS